METAIEKMTGTVDKVYFSNDRFAAVSVVNSTGNFRCAGNIPAPCVGVKMEFEGHMEIDAKYGPQFKVHKASISKDLSPSAMQAYLSSKYIKGVGKATAQLLVETFGAETLDVIENHPERLEEVKGISTKKAKKLHESHMEHMAYTAIYEVFNGNISDFKAKQIYDCYGSKSIDVIKTTPYRLIHDIDGFGFYTVDRLALASGISPNSEDRLGAAITQSLQELSADGNCYISADGLEQRMGNVLRMEIAPEEAAKVLAGEIKENHLVYESAYDRLYLKPIYEAEVLCAYCIAEMAVSRPFKVIGQTQLFDAFTKVQAKCGFAFTDLQKTAVCNAVTRRISIITGGPGCGKTTIVKAIARAWGKDNIRLVAPTGKASRRLSEAAGGLDAGTIHRWLFSPNDKRETSGRGKQPELVICDEASMLDIKIAARFIQKVYEEGSSVVFIGDADQLPPIGPGSFFHDLLSTDLPITVLDLSHRNSGSIALNAHAVNAGTSMSAFVYDDSFRFIRGENSDAFNAIVNQYIALVKKYGIENVCCLTPMKAEGKDESVRVNSEPLNKAIRERLNPIKPDSLLIPGCKFRKGDRVMQTVNDYKKGVFNGDCGIVYDVNPEEEEVTVLLDSGDFASYSRVDTSQLKLAYAMTIHKSQGSEYDAVVMACCPEHSFLLQRNMIYTGITRAKKEVVLVGEPKTINMAIHRAKAVERATALRQRIRKAMS